MKAPRKVVTITLSPKQAKEKREADARAKLMASVSFDQVWKDTTGVEYTTLLLSNVRVANVDGPATVTYYGPDGKYLSETLDRFVDDKVFLRNFEPTMTPAEHELGGWLSASLEDPGSCKEFKQAVESWFKEMPIPTLTKEIK